MNAEDRDKHRTSNEKCGQPSKQAQSKQNPAEKFRKCGRPGEYHRRRKPQLSGPRDEAFTGRNFADAMSRRDGNAGKDPEQGLAGVGRNR